MQVDPTRLVELAASSETILSAMADDWAQAQDDLAAACASLGDAVGAMNVTSSYADALGDASEVVAALTHALELGVTGLVDVAHDAVKADETVVSEISRAANSIQHGALGPGPGRGGRR